MDLEEEGVVGRMTNGSSALLIGAHTVDNGGIHMAARRAGAAGMRALQIFTAIPKYYGDKSSIRPERVRSGPGRGSVPHGQSEGRWQRARRVRLSPTVRPFVVGRHASS